MKIWIDGDSCPRQAMDLLLRTGERRCLDVVVVADRKIPKVSETGAEMVIVPHGSGEVDEYIHSSSVAGDIVLTRDFALGLRLIENGISVMNDRGKIWTMAELKSRLEEAELMKAIRDGGITNRSSRSYDSVDARAFAAALERLLNSLGNDIVNR